jgi:hypothetical protein
MWLKLSIRDKPHCAHCSFCAESTSGQHLGNRLIGPDVGRVHHSNVLNLAARNQNVHELNLNLLEFF